jgi:small subunit ribosomal protein S5
MIENDETTVVVEEEKKEEKDVHKKEIREAEERRFRRRPPGDRRGFIPEDKKPVEWIPKTKLGQEVLSGKYSDIEHILKSGQLILEPEITDYLVPDLKSEVIYIGGSPGKGGGIRRTATKRTVRMHKSGRRFKLTSVTVVGNENGVIGLGKASSREHKTALEKALAQAKMNVISVRNGCGSWECHCGENHSIPFKTSARYGTVNVTLIPGPKGLGLVANPPVKKILTLAGIKDVWAKSEGNTRARSNLVYATFEALRNLNRTKGDI